MRFFIQVVLSALISLILGPYLVYWVLMLIIAGMAALIKGPAFLSFVAGAIGVGSVWVLVPLFIWSGSDSDLPEKIAAIMGMGNSALLVGISGLIGFFIGGSSALAGNLFGKLFENNPPY
ncbi:MAG: hypothetical protein WDZ72_06275 [Cyclobacteriaceae bacterium]